MSAHGVRQTERAVTQSPLQQQQLPQCPITENSSVSELDAYKKVPEVVIDGIKVRGNSLWQRMIGRSTRKLGNIGAVQNNLLVVQRRVISLKNGRLIITDTMTEDALIRLSTEIHDSDLEGAQQIRDALAKGEYLPSKCSQESGTKGESTTRKTSRQSRPPRRQDVVNQEKLVKRRLRQVQGHSGSGEVQGTMTQILEKLSKILHNNFTQEEATQYLETNVEPEEKELDTQGTTAIGYLDGDIIIARQNRHPTIPLYFGTLLQTLGLTVRNTVVVTAADLLMSESSGLHAESYIIQYLLIKFMRTKKIEPRLLNMENSADQELFQDFLSTIVNRLQVGASQEACWDCAGFLNSVCVAHGEVRETPSDMWVHPITGEVYSSEHNPPRKEIEKEGVSGKRRKTDIINFEVPDFVLKRNVTGAGFDFPQEVVNALITGSIHPGDNIKINGSDFRFAVNKETGQIALFIRLRGG